MSPGTNPPFPGLNVQRQMLWSDFEFICFKAFRFMDYGLLVHPLAASMQAKSDTVDKATKRQPDFKRRVPGTAACISFSAFREQFQLQG
jgi:hypothetical protein